MAPPKSECRVEARSNTSTVSLRSLEAMKKEPSAWGYNRAALFQRDINMRTWPPELGVSGI
jgi:hypothetical protein